MVEIIATYSPCCGIFHTGDAEQGIMHCALPHERKVVKLVDVKELEILSILEEENRRLKVMNRRFEMALRGLGYTSDNSIFIQVTRLT
jgi:hypothetical protein